MNNETKGFLLFLGGVVWAAATSKKAYAPTMMTNLDPNRECAPGTTKEPIICTMGMDKRSLECKAYSDRMGGFRCI